MIDDDQDDREIFQEAMRICCPQAELMFATDGENALRILKMSPHNPDVIFLDYNMPGMTGLDCLRALKSQEKTRSIPVVMYTTSRDADDKNVAYRLGANYFITKPNSFDDLKRVLGLIDNDGVKIG